MWYICKQGPRLLLLLLGLGVSVNTTGHSNLLMSKTPLCGCIRPLLCTETFAMFLLFNKQSREHVSCTAFSPLDQLQG
jgi:hypothetical protein